MKRTRHISSTSHPAFGRRAERLTLAALAGIAMTFIAPALPTDAAGRPTGRVCASTASLPAPVTYTVAVGDSWFSVATAAGVIAAALLASNDAAASTVLHPGDVLCLPEGASFRAPTPDPAACVSKHTIVKGDSWFQISRAAAVSLASLLDANGATSTTVLHPGAELCLPPGAPPVATANPCVSKRTVAAGESWYVISRSTGVPMQALYLANDASASSSLYPGQSLCLPEVGFGRGLRTLLEVGPVRGSCRFANSWMASRGDRLHVGVDLISPAGTPVVAAASGTLTRQTKLAARSGNAWWLTTPSGTYFFYAHLSGFANGLTVGSRVRAGDVIGYVGSTGNSVSPHLHFEIHPYGGGPINPYDSIWTVGGCSYDRRYEQAPLS